MLVVMQSDATPDQVSRVIESIRQIDLTPHTLPGPTRTAIAITGNTGAVDARVLEVLPGVKECIRVTKQYKLASREMHEQDTTVRLPRARSATAILRSSPGRVRSRMKTRRCGPPSPSIPAHCSW